MVQDTELKTKYEVSYFKQDTNYFKNFHGNVHLNIPVKLFTDEKRYTGNDILIYALIAALGYKSGYCYASNQTLSIMCHNCSPTTIQNSINKLVKYKLLYKTFKKFNGRKYRILYTSELAMQENKDIILKNLNKELQRNTEELFDYDWLNDSNETSDEKWITIFKNEDKVYGRDGKEII